MQYIFADGSHSKPELILPCTELPAVDKALLDKFVWRGQSKGWVTSEIFFESLSTTFLDEITRRRQMIGDPSAPALLVMDGHKSHTTDAVKEFCAKHNIELEIFVPHASHIQQPLDLVFFAVYKRVLTSVCENIYSLLVSLLTVSADHKRD